MNKFGFSISQTRTVNLDTTDRTILHELELLEPSYKRCMNCGSCTATCSAQQFTNFNIRRVHTSFRRGEYRTLSDELKKCMLCGKCTLVCPRGVNLRSLVINMRQILEEPEIK